MDTNVLAQAPVTNHNEELLEATSGTSDTSINQGDEASGDIHSDLVDLLSDPDVQNALDAPPETQTEINEEEDTDFRRHRRHRKGENVKPTPLQIRYQRQVREGRAASPALVEDMSKLVAWTWIPGRDRKECPPIVDLRDARLMVMDRFPDETTGDCSRVGLSMYRSAMTKQGRTHYASPANIEMFKDFSIRPHFRAGGLCLDSRNEDVFRTALALDQAMELVARGKADPVQTFVPPPTLFGFPRHYVPAIEWQAPMMGAVVKQLHPEAPYLRCLLSPGGTVNEVASGKDNIRIISMVREGSLHQIRVPDWLKLLPHVQPGSQVAEGQPLADLPRGVYSCIKEVTQQYSYTMLQWLELRILDELTETISVEEEVYDRQTKQRKPITTTWCCVPSQFVQTQVGRAVRFFLDFRRHLGRQKWSIDLSERDVWSTDEHQARIDVCAFPARPTPPNLLFAESTDEKKCTWYADLMTAPDGAVWTPRCPLRGVADPIAA